MQDKANTPAEITETALDDISGGPHWTTWDPPTYRTARSVSNGGTAQAAASSSKSVTTEDGWIIELNRE